MKKKASRSSRRPRPKIKITRKTVRRSETKKMKTHFSKARLNSFKQLLIRRKQSLMHNLSQMEDETLSNSRRDAAGDLSNMPMHIADMGSDTYEQDFTLELIQGEGEEIHEIDAALERIDEQTYGVCERCGQAISEKRLVAIPYARFCITCKEKEETGG